MRALLSLRAAARLVDSSCQLNYCSTLAFGHTRTTGADVRIDRLLPEQLGRKENLVRSYGVTRLRQKRARGSAYPGDGGQLTLLSLLRPPRTMSMLWLIAKTLVLGTAFKQGNTFSNGSDPSQKKSVLRWRK